jgi:ATP-dependent Lhr-like helicase
VFGALKEHGAMFQSELRALTGRLPAEVEEGLWHLVARGLVTADGFGAVRSLFSTRERWNRRHHHDRRLRPSARPIPALRRGSEGRWALLPTHQFEAVDSEDLAEYVAGQLLDRWGVVFWEITARENLSVPWRELLWALRRLEARGLVRGGRFVNGLAGEQYALPEALDELRRTRREEHTGQLVRLSAADPLNLRGIVLPGTRIPAVRTHRVTYCDGLPVPDEGLSHLQRSVPAHGHRQAHA